MDFFELMITLNGGLELASACLNLWLRLIKLSYKASNYGLIKPRQKGGLRIKEGRLQREADSAKAVRFWQLVNE